VDSASEEVPLREYKGFDPTFRQWAKSKLTVEKTKKVPARIDFKTELPRDPVARSSSRARTPADD
jgi:hypothetical protein